MAIPTDKSLLYLYDLPKGEVTSVQITTKIKDLTGYELTEPPQIRRQAERLFYTAIVKINDPEKFKEISEKIKYFDINDKPCRALPYDRDLLGVNREKIANQNVFLKSIPTNLRTAEVDKSISDALDVKIKSAKVSLNEDHTSRGYGFVLFQTPEDAQKLLAQQNLGFEAIKY